MSEELGAAGREPWAAPDENTPMLNYSPDATERHSQPFPSPDEPRVSITPFRRVKVLLKARTIIIGLAVSTRGGYAPSLHVSKG